MRVARAATTVVGATAIAVVAGGLSSRLLVSRGAVAATPGTQKAVDPFAFDPEQFEKKRAPQPGDWLNEHDEADQSFRDYVRSGPVRATAKRRVIVIQPIGPFAAEEGDASLLETLREYTSVFFQLPVRLAPVRPLPLSGFRRRTDIAPRHVQFHTGVLLRELAAHLPDDAICVLGVTMVDLYPEASWNFVFGQASLSHRVGIYSLWRYDLDSSKGAAAKRSKTALLRAIKVLAHEAGHMFSIAHCTMHECLMNGSNSLDEMDRAPAHLCPECLHKLQWNLGFDVTRRETHLLQFYRRHGLSEEAAWTARRLTRLAPQPRL